MKKIILGVITCLLSLSVFGQVNEFKFGFPLRANGGLNVGTDKVQLDSIVRDGTTIKFYTGVTELLPNMAGGSVTSVGMTVPTGLSISGSPITGSGTLALTFAPGYSIPSDASQSNWNTAYNWGDHVLGGYESSLGNPSVDGYILSSTTTGTRSWIAPPSGGSMIYPSGSGIPLIVSGTSWGTTITDNSANWNTAYGWGNHASAGYQTSTAILNSFAALTNSAGVLTNDGSGGLTWTSVGGSGTVTSVALSVPTGLSVTGSPITSSGTLAISLASGYSIPSTSVQSNWTTAYNERAQWDGGSTNLVASTGRTSLGATTVGSNLFTLNNPNAIRFIQINANNTVSALTAADLKTALSLTASDVSLGNVTNESKTTMFTSPIFTGVAPRLGSPVTDTVATRDNIRSSISALLSGGIQLSDVAVMKEDTLTSSGIYYTQRQVDSIIAAITGVSLTDVRNEIADSINKIRAESIPGLAEADTADLVATQHYVATHGGSSWDSAYIHYRVDSLSTVVDAQATEIENLWNALALLGDMDIIAPRFESAELGSFADDTLVVLMDTTDVRQDSVPPLTAFTLWAGAIEHGIASVDIGHDTLYIALDSAAVYGTVYSLDYTRGTPALQDSTGNKTASWTGRSVTNNMPEPEAGVPAFLNSDGYTFTWIEALATNLTLNGTQVTSINDKGPNNHDWTGQGTPGTQWDSANEELDFTYGSAAGLSVSSAPTTMPVTVYMVVRLEDWADGGAIFYFSVPNAKICQGGNTPDILLFAGQHNLFEATDLATYGVITATINGATSSIQWNDDTPVTGNAGTNTLDSTYYIGYHTDNANMSIKEVIVRSTNDSAQNRTDVKAYLYDKYSITP